MQERIIAYLIEEEQRKKAKRPKNIGNGKKSIRGIIWL
jgi:hypothetical protein